MTVSDGMTQLAPDKISCAALAIGGYLRSSEALKSGRGTFQKKEAE